MLLKPTKKQSPTYGFSAENHTLGEFDRTSDCLLILPYIPVISNPASSKRN